MADFAKCKWGAPTPARNAGIRPENIFLWVPSAAAGPCWGERSSLSPLGATTGAGRRGAAPKKTNRVVHFADFAKCWRATRGRRGGLSPYAHGLSPPRRANAALCPARQRGLLRRKSSPRLGGQTRETAGGAGSATGGRPGGPHLLVFRSAGGFSACARPNSGIAHRGGEGRARSPTGARGATFFHFFPVSPEPCTAVHTTLAPPSPNRICKPALRNHRGPPPKGTGTWAQERKFAESERAAPPGAEAVRHPPRGNLPGTCPAGHQRSDLSPVGAWAPAAVPGRGRKPSFALCGFPRAAPTPARNAGNRPKTLSPWSPAPPQVPCGVSGARWSRWGRQPPLGAGGEARKK